MTIQHTHPSQLAATGRGLVAGGLIAICYRLAVSAGFFAASRHAIGSISGLVTPTTVDTGTFKRWWTRFMPWRKLA